MTPAQVYIGSTARAYTAYFRGRFTETLVLAEQAAALYEPGMLPELMAFGAETILMPHVYQAWALWNLGEIDEAIRRWNVIPAIVEALRSPFVLGMALFSENNQARDLRDPERVERGAERLMELAREQEFPFLYAAAQCEKGWAVCQRGDRASGIALIQSGLELHTATGMRLSMGYWDSFLIEAYLTDGRIAEGLAVTREALFRSETQLDVNHDAELLRLEGELLHTSGDDQAAEASFRKALDVAREQSAHFFELRTAVSLGRLLEKQGRVEEALSTLSAVYQTFREGFATPDLQEARELLDRLS